MSNVIELFRSNRSSIPVGVAVKWRTKYTTRRSYVPFWRIALKVENGWLTSDGMLLGDDEFFDVLASEYTAEIKVGTAWEDVS